MPKPSYKEYVAYGAYIMYEGMRTFLHYGIDIACLEELKDVILEGEEVDVTLEILETMQDPLSRKIGEVVSFTIDNLKVILKRNEIEEKKITGFDESAGIKDEPVDEAKEATQEEYEAFMNDPPQVQRQLFIGILIEFTQENIKKINTDVINNLAKMNGYDTSMYADFEEARPFYAACGDGNIELFALYCDKINELYKYILVNE
jgi:hypothetical protein